MSASDASIHFAAPSSGQRSGAARWFLLFTVRLYRVFFSPFFGAACKFHPSCSEYALQAIERWGARRGAWLALKRLGRCRPFSPGGYDSVPELPDENSVAAVQAVQTREVSR